MAPSLRVRVAAGAFDERGARMPLRHRPAPLCVVASRSPVRSPAAERSGVLRQAREAAATEEGVTRELVQQGLSGAAQKGGDSDCSGSSSALVRDCDGQGAHEQQEAGEERFKGSAKGLALLNLGALLFGTNQVAIKSAEASCSPGLLSAVRFTTAAICFAPSTIKGMRDPEVRRAALELGVYLTGGYVGQAFGLTQTTATHGALTGTFTVIAVPMYVGLSGSKVSTVTWVSAALAMLGVGLLTTDNTMPNIGDAWCILSAMIFGMHKFRSETITRQMPEKTNMLMASQLSVLALGSCAAAAIEMQVDGQSLQAMQEMLRQLPLPNIIYMGVATTALTLWIEMEALKEVTAPLAALIYSVEPLWGAGFAYLLMGDRWGPQGWVGGAFIILASVGSQVLEGMAPKEAE